jgi:23S rRNA (guanosine2251-2'-O)-methyltransferase
MKNRGHDRRTRSHEDRRVPDRSERYEAARSDIVFGVEPVKELARAAPEIIRTLYIRIGDERRFLEEVTRVRAAGGHVAHADDAELARQCGRDARHQGVVAMVREYQYADLDEMIAGHPDPILVIDGVTDPRNLGAILRSAEGAGAGNIIIAKDRTVGVTPAAVKSSAGAWIHTKIARCGNVARALEDLKEAGYWVAALAPGGGVSIYELDVSRRLAMVIGSEGKGVREIIKKTADFIVDIPMRGKVASLNVSVATAVALYEVARRRSEVASKGGG